MSGATGGSAEGEPDEGGANQRAAGGGATPLHDRAAGHAPGLCGTVLCQCPCACCKGLYGCGQLLLFSKDIRKKRLNKYCNIRL